MEKDNNFIDGMFVNQPKETTPDYVKADISIKVFDFVKYAESNQNAKGYLNLQILVSKAGKHYAKLNTWTPKKSDEDKMLEDIQNEEQIPF